MLHRGATVRAKGGGFGTSAWLPCSFAVGNH